MYFQFLPKQYLFLFFGILFNLAAPANNDTLKLHHKYYGEIGLSGPAEPWKSYGFEFGYQVINSSRYPIYLSLFYFRDEYSANLGYSEYFSETQGIRTRVIQNLYLERFSETSLNLNYQRFIQKNKNTLKLMLGLGLAYNRSNVKVGTWTEYLSFSDSTSYREESFNHESKIIDPIQARINIGLQAHITPRIYFQLNQRIGLMNLSGIRSSHIEIEQPIIFNFGTLGIGFKFYSNQYIN